MLAFRFPPIYPSQPGIAHQALWVALHHVSVTRSVASLDSLRGPCGRWTLSRVCSWPSLWPWHILFAHSICPPGNSLPPAPCPEEIFIHVSAVATTLFPGSALPTALDSLLTGATLCLSVHPERGVVHSDLDRSNYLRTGHGPNFHRGKLPGPWQESQCNRPQLVSTPTLAVGAKPGKLPGCSS